MALKVFYFVRKYAYQARIPRLQGKGAIFLLQYLLGCRETVTALNRFPIPCCLFITK
jgi:hypothetical protein